MTQAKQKADELRVLAERAIAFMRHSGLCGIVGGYGHCTCGLDKAEADLRAAILETEQ